MARAGVPALEPPAPVSARVRSRVTTWKWWLDRGQELPSWMTSMVLHLAIAILFASLAVKSGPRPNAVFMLDLSVTMADQIDDHLSAVEIMPIASSPQTHQVRARVLYRRFWKSTADAKLWPDDTVTVHDEHRVIDNRDGALH